jgi:hypothetical protein
VELESTNHNADALAKSCSTPTAVNMIVLNNNLICVTVLRAGSIVISLTFILQLVLRATAPGLFRDIAKIFDIALLATALALFVLQLSLDRALNRCPICRTRSTSKTEEKRHCLNCDTALWV